MKRGDSNTSKSKSFLRRCTALTCTSRSWNALTS